jgi:hypothetical protein
MYNNRYSAFLIFELLPIISSPEPKAQGELLVSKGGDSGVRRHASTIVFFSETAGQI